MGSPSTSRAARRKYTDNLCFFGFNRHIFVGQGLPDFLIRDLLIDLAALNNILSISHSLCPLAPVVRDSGPGRNAENMEFHYR